MKILHINTFSYGGAFHGSYRLHLALLREGIQSKMLVRDMVDNNKFEEVYFYKTSTRHRTRFNSILSKMSRPITASQKIAKYLKGKKGKYEILSFPFSDFDITNSKEYKEADIINLHWTAGFLDYENFFKTCKKPLVVTLRDLFPIQGIFHYEDDLKRNSSLYGDLDERMFELKKKSLAQISGTLNFVGISNWIAEKSKESEIHSAFNHTVIHNCINVDNYNYQDKKLAKSLFNISEEKIVFSFIGGEGSHWRKGIDLVRGAFEDMEDTSDIIILTAGGGAPPKFPFHIVHRHLGNLNQNELSMMYSASDAFIFPSREEALGNVMLEAMACGTAVIGTPVGGLLDVIKPGFNGILSKNVTPEGLKEAIIEFIKIKDSFNHKEIRKHIQENFSESTAAQKYIALYEKLLS